MENKKPDISDIIQQIKEAILETMERLEKAELTVSSILVQLQSIVVGAPGASGGVKLGPITLEMSEKEITERANILTFHFIPEDVGIELMGNIDQELVESINLVASTVLESKNSYPKFRLDFSRIELNFGITNEGKISLLLSSETQNKNYHKIVLEIKES